MINRTTPRQIDANIARFHFSMLNDRTRTQAFLDGIAQVVQSGDVVVDIGTGTGILAMAAARAGAKHVYAIEAGPIGDVALELVKANHMADRVTVLRGKSSETCLPELADVMVAELIGNTPFGEQIIPTALDARKRLLKPDARFVPRQLRVFGVPVTVPEEGFKKLYISPNDLSNWHAWYGVDFLGLWEAGRDGDLTIFATPQKCLDWTQLAEPVLLAAVDLCDPPEEVNVIGAKSTVNTEGIVNGLLLFFEAELGPGTILSTNPRCVSSDNHWRTPLLVKQQPIAVKVGDTLRVLYHVNAKTDGKETMAVFVTQSK
jgi:hypothetical protein